MHSPGFVRYVMTDELNKDGRGACGHRKAVDYDSLLVADPIDTNLKTMSLPARTVQPGFGCNVGFLNRLLRNVSKGALLVMTAPVCCKRLNLEITVSSRELPATFEWAYHLGFVAKSLCSGTLLSGSFMEPGAFWTLCVL